MNIIDIHTHGIGGYDTRTTVEDHILKIAEIHGSHGISAIVPAIYPAAVNIMRGNMEAVKKAIKKQQSAVSSQRSGVDTPEDSEFKTQNSNSPLPMGNPPHFLEKGGKGGFEREESDVINQPSRIVGVYLEGPFLNPSRCGALSAESFIEPTEYSLKELIEGYEDIIKIITIAPEIKGAAGLIRKISDMGIIASMGHSDATYADAEAGFNAGARGVTHIFNGMGSFHHRDPGLAGFGLLNQDIYIEVIADPYHLHLKTVELIFRTKNHDRIIIVSDTVKEANTASGNQAVTDSHGRLSGGCMPVTESSKRLIEMGYDEGDILNCITENPGRYLSGK